MKEHTYDIAIVGGGVVGSALLYLLRQYTTAGSIALLEKESEVGLVQSNARNNSQTLHFGDIETNYTREKAETVNEAAMMVARYLDALPKGSPIYQKRTKMVLAVGAEEVARLEKRFEAFRDLYPNLSLIYRDKIAELEPKVVEGRDASEPLAALHSTDGYIVDYGALARSFVDAAALHEGKTDILRRVEVENVERDGETFRLTRRDGGVMRAKVVVFSTGAHSLTFAKQLGLGEELIILPVAGSFFYTPNVLNGKVYTLQIPKLPFAAVHGDPDIIAQHRTRFGPTAKVIPMLERFHYRSFWSFLRLFDVKLGSFLSIASILADPVYLGFVARNVLYDLPWIGSWFFLPNIRKIIPTIRFRDVHYARGFGGIRPQVVNRKTRKVSLGESRVVGEKAIFNITPSPGASTCLAAAVQDLRTLEGFFDGALKIDEEALNRDLLSDV